MMNKIFRATLISIVFYFCSIEICAEQNIDLKKNVYVLKTGKEAKETLDKQHLIYAENSYKQLKKAGLAPGKVVWDLGCGSGAVTEHIAKIVGEGSGHVYALDISPEQIEISKNRLQKAGLQNVTFITGDAATTNLPIGQADIVFGRFFLMHQKDPKKVLAKMRSLLKPGGVLVLQESIMSATHFSVENPEIKEYVKTIVALGKSKGVDFNIGTRLTKLCKEAGFKKIRSNYDQLKVGVKEAEPLFLARIAEFQDAMIGAKLVTTAKIDQWKNTAKRLFATADSSFYVAFAKQNYVLARK